MLEQLGGRNQLTTLAAHAFELADALYALGRYEESGRWALRGLELGSNDDLMTQSLGRAVRSRHLARQGDLSAALTMAVEIDGLARTWDSPAEQRGYRAQSRPGLVSRRRPYTSATVNPSGTLLGTPDVVVEPTLAQILAGDDPVLAAALSYQPARRD
jgi:hypothetical protein